MKRICLALFIALSVLCLAASCAAEASPSSTVPPQDASSVDYLFGSGIEKVNEDCRSLMDGIGSANNYPDYSMTSWPVANGRREPIWSDFSPKNSNYIPEFFGQITSGKDRNGVTYLRYEIELLDLSIDDWRFSIVNSGVLLECEYVDGAYISEYFHEDFFSPEEYILGRDLAPNVSVSFHFSVNGERTQTWISWEDDDYAIDWVYHYYRDNGSNINLMKMHWKADGGSVYALYDADSGNAVDAIIATEK
ncbi:MAG: hypothetical protein IKQ41_01825 [Clostridia bacterium]|nr:hypothetical protein [Clostridia bacterium]